MPLNVTELVYMAINVPIQQVKVQEILQRDRAKCSKAGFYGYKCFNIMGMGAEKILERDGIKCNRAGFYSYKRL